MSIRFVRAAARLAPLVGIVCASAATAAVVGQTSSSPPPKRDAASIDQLRHDYRRPATIPFPKDNPYTVAKLALGKTLYFDTRLSRANVLACASCHNPGYGWGDGQPKGIGDGMNALGRRSPSILNAAYGQIFMWDGRAGSLEEQAPGRIKTDVERTLPIDKLMERLKAVPEYGPMFAAAFPKDGITPDNVARAIATFERTVVSAQSPFDAWVAGNDK